MRRSFTKKEEGKNSMEVLLVLHNWEIEIKFRFMVGTHRTLERVKEEEGVLKEMEPVWDMGRPEPSPIMISSVPL